MISIQGVSIPALGLGTWRLSGREGGDAVRAALEIGYRHIDTAQMYENESDVGAALKASGVPRGEIFLTTKLWSDSLRKARVPVAVEESLRRLKTGYVDLLLIHWPNPDVPLAETLEAMREVQRQGKARLIGVSNFPVAWMREAVERCGAAVACNQVEYHALLSQRKVLNYARTHGMMVTAYSPLARGQLVNHPVLERIGQKHGKSAGQVALRWLMEQENVAAIPKAAHAENARRNFAIFDFTLDAEDMRAIDAINGDGRQINPAFAPQWDAA
jgi:2,5-diketo-D-gluconate reductase B